MDMVVGKRVVVGWLVVAMELAVGTLVVTVGIYI